MSEIGANLAFPTTRIALPRRQAHVPLEHRSVHETADPLSSCRAGLTIWSVVDHASVQRWVDGYEAAWRTPGTDGLAALFSRDATYFHSPYADPVVGLEAIGIMWEAERDGPDEVFILSNEIFAVDGPVAVVRAVVRYGDPLRQEYTDLWLLRFDEEGRCSWFEEWPYWPGRRWSARDE